MQTLASNVYLLCLYVLNKKHPLNDTRPKVKSGILALILTLSSSCVAVAAEYKILDEVGTPPDAAHICRFWGVTIFAPGETPSCKIGTLFTVDLEHRVIRYENVSSQGLPDEIGKRNQERSWLIGAMEGDGVATLEKLRVPLVAQREKVRKKAAEEKAKAEYLEAFDAATTLPKIAEFESRYTNNDPDELIPKLMQIKARLNYENYRAAYAAATTSSELTRFVTDYSSNDPDMLVLEAKKRIPVIQKQELLAEQQAERKRQEEQRQQELAAKQAAKEKDRKRLQYIQQLRVRYAKNIVSDSTDAYRIVSQYKIDCRVSDGRVLPLIHALYVTIAQTEAMGGKSIFRLQSNGQQVRIYESIYKNGKQIGGPTLYYQINEWSELRPVAISAEALLNACIGSSGPIWLMPSELDRMR